MQQRAGLLYLSSSTKKLLLILDNQSWSVPTFERKGSLFSDAEQILNRYAYGKILPIELYTSEDKGFEYGTYICLVKEEFIIRDDISYAWVTVNDIPKNLHTGLKYTLNNHITKIKIQTILELANEHIQQ